ncbi:MAG: glycosyltransferase family 2 protein [Planctomycetes bacterium]|nr:glycosyltransferase family 2 protein [Planctomycetota bacterium]
MEHLPTVTVIVLNYNGVRHLEGCLPSLTELDYPGDRLDLMVVDNASTDGSVEFLRARYPRVRVVRTEKNVGFGAGNNFGARQAGGEYVVFLNNDMWVDRGLVRNLVQAVRSEAGVVSAGAKILNWDGTRFDFAGAACHFTGLGYQTAFGEAYDRNRFGKIEPILFPCGGAMIIDRRVFLDSGGFDADYFIYYEDVDLGWRLWVLGHKVMFAPEALVQHRHHGTMDSFSDYRKQVLYRRNSLCSVIKNYEESNLARVLPATLLGMVSGVVNRAVRSGELDLSDYHITSPLDPGRDTVAFEKANTSTLVAIQEVIGQMSGLMRKRAEIQGRRRRSDREIAPLFHRPFSAWSDVLPRVQFALVDGFRVHDLFAELSRRVLVVCDDLVPLSGLPAGTRGRRAWSVGQALASAGHEVRFALPETLLRGQGGVTPEELRALAWVPATIDAVILAHRPDVVMVVGLDVLAHLRGEPGCPVVLDFDGTGGECRQVFEILARADFATFAGNASAEAFGTLARQAGIPEFETGDWAALVPDLQGGGGGADVSALDRFIRRPRMRPRPFAEASAVGRRGLGGLFRKVRSLYRRGGMVEVWRKGWGQVLRVLGRRAGTRA